MLMSLLYFLYLLLCKIFYLGIHLYVFSSNSSSYFKQSNLKNINLGLWGSVSIYILLFIITRLLSFSIFLFVRYICNGESYSYYCFLIKKGLLDRLDLQDCEMLLTEMFSKFDILGFNYRRLTLNVDFYCIFLIFCIILFFLFVLHW